MCDDNTSFCPECGTPLPQQQYNNTQQYSNTSNYGPGNYSASRFGITPRSIPLCIIFSLITCGIYGIYWLYKMGDRCDRIKGMNGSSGILYLILGLVGFSIISYCLIQDTLNKAV